MAGQINFIRSIIEDIPATGKRQYFYDKKVPGLELMVTAKGSKSFYFHRRIKGTAERVLIGRYPASTPTQARDRARELNAQMTMGQNPASDVQALRDAMLFSTGFSDYMERHARPRKKSWAQDQGLYDRYLKPWAHRRISDVDYNAIHRLHAKIGENKGKVVANRVLSLLHTMYGKWRVWGYLTGDNPASGVEKFKEQSSERYLSFEEVEAFMAAIEEEPDQTVKDLLHMALYTAARKANVLAMQFDEITSLDSEKPLWRIPDTKGGHPVEIPLSPEAVEILKRRRGSANNSPWVFPGRGARGHFADPKRPIKRVYDRAGIKGASFHTLRHTLASWMTNEGYSLQVIGKALGHRSIRSTQVYAHLTDDPVRTAISSTAAKMANGKTSSGRNVTEEQRDGS